MAVFGILPGAGAGLYVLSGTVDTFDMRLTDGQSTEFEQQCLTVLSCYQVRELAAKSADPEYAGWVDRIMEAGELRYFDKVETKFASFDREQFARAGVRVVPPAVARRGAFVARNVVLMPSYVNIEIGRAHV